MIKQFIRDDLSNRRKGIMVAFISNNELKIGYSACNPSDTFDPKLGEAIAIGRAHKGNEYIPNRYYSDAVLFIARCKRYFKGISYPSWFSHYEVSE